MKKAKFKFSRSSIYSGGGPCWPCKICSSRGGQKCYTRCRKGEMASKMAECGGPWPSGSNHYCRGQGTVVLLAGVCRGRVNTFTLCPQAMVYLVLTSESMNSVRVTTVTFCVRKVQLSLIALLGCHDPGSIRHLSRVTRYHRTYGQCGRGHEAISASGLRC